MILKVKPVISVKASLTVVKNALVFVVLTTCKILPAVTVPEAPKSIDVPLTVTLSFANLEFAILPAYCAFVIDMSLPNLSFVTESSCNFVVVIASSAIWSDLICDSTPAIAIILETSPLFL